MSFTNITLFLKRLQVMKETIYTIPVNEAYESDCECPLCKLEEKLEKEAIDYEMGGAMMEADHRELSDNTGFCNKHLSMMFNKQDKLSLALVLDTRLEKIRKELNNSKKDVLKNKKSTLFKKNTNSTQMLYDILDKINCSCMVCQKVDNTMNRYIDVLLYMWAKDDDFKTKFDNSKGLCLKHTKAVVGMIPKSLNNSNAQKFMETLMEKQEKELLRVQNDIHKFTLKFDYRNKDMEWGTAHDAPIRTIEKLTGYVFKENEK